MKVKLNKRSKPDFPKVMVWEQYSMVAIFFSAKKGIVIDSGNTDTLAGSEVSEISNFTDFDGDLILRND